MLGQNLKNGGGGQGAGGGETGSREVTLGGTEFPSYPTLGRTGSGRDPGELLRNLISININLNILKAEATQVFSRPFLCLNLHSSLSCISLHSFSPTFPLNLPSFAPLFT